MTAAGTGTAGSILRRAAAENAVVAGLMAAYVAAAAVTALVWRVHFSLKLYGVFWLAMAFGLGVFALVRNFLPRRWRAGERLSMAAPVLLLAPAFFSAFTSLKNAIGHVVPYAWDAALAGADRTLLGQDAWRLLQPALGHPPVTFVLSTLYSGWHLALIVAFGAVTLSVGRPRLRAQALIAMFACWAVLGTWAAVAFASAGPCFAFVFHPDQAAAFAAQADYLKAANGELPIFEFMEQQRLLSASRSGAPILGSGISAMPSMHVAIALLMALIGWKWGRIAGVIATAYLTVVIIASIHLGWHYAVDSVAALAGAAVIWVLSGLVAGLGQAREAASA